MALNYRNLFGDPFYEPPLGVQAADASGLVYGADSYGNKFNPNVNAALLDIIQTAATQFPLKVVATSGLSGRSTGTTNHPTGRAIDVQIYDQNGNPLANYAGNPFGVKSADARAAYPVYEQFAQLARSIQEQKYPKLAGAFRWGGYFTGGVNPGDLMHFDISGGRPGTPSMPAAWDRGIGNGMTVGAAALKNLPQAAAAEAPTDPWTGLPIQAQGVVATGTPSDAPVAHAAPAVSDQGRNAAIRTAYAEDTLHPEGPLSVIYNRTQDKRYSSDPLEVVSKGEFSAFGNDLYKSLSPSDPVYQQLGAQWDAMQAGTANPVTVATHYLNPSIAKAQAWQKTMPFQGIIGQQAYYGQVIPKQQVPSISPDIVASIDAWTGLPHKSEAVTAAMSPVDRGIKVAGDGVPVSAIPVGARIAPEAAAVAYDPFRAVGATDAASGSAIPYAPTQSTGDWTPVTGSSADLTALSQAVTSAPMSAPNVRSLQHPVSTPAASFPDYGMGSFAGGYGDYRPSAAPDSITIDNSDRPLRDFGGSPVESFANAMIAGKLPGIATSGLRLKTMNPADAGAGINQFYDLMTADQRAGVDKSVSDYGSLMGSKYVDMFHHMADTAPPPTPMPRTRPDYSPPAQSVAPIQLASAGQPSYDVLSSAFPATKVAPIADPVQTAGMIPDVPDIMDPNHYGPAIDPIGYARLASLNSPTYAGKGKPPPPPVNTTPPVHQAANYPSHGAGATGQGGVWNNQGTRNSILNYLNSQGVSHGSSIGYTPEGYHSPNFDPISGGAIFAYKPDGQGGGTFIDSHGNEHPY